MPERLAPNEEERHREHLKKLALALFIVAGASAILGASTQGEAQFAAGATMITAVFFGTVANIMGNS